MDFGSTDFIISSNNNPNVFVEPEQYWFATNEFESDPFIPAANSLQPVATTSAFNSSAPLAQAVHLAAIMPHNSEALLPMSNEPPFRGNPSEKIRQSPEAIKPGFRSRLDEIEWLIQQATTEEDIDKLKKERRLIRNREHAYVFRQFLSMD